MVDCSSPIFTSLTLLIYVLVFSRQIAAVVPYIIESRSHTTDTVAKYTIQLLNDSFISRKPILFHIA